MRKPPARLGLITAMLLAAWPSSANVKAELFSDHMVLQRGRSVPVFGTAEAGEQVTAEFRGQTRAVTAGKDGKWRVDLDPMDAGGPFTLSLRGKNTLSIQDVMVGDVWFCSGQSNMAYHMFEDPLNTDSAKHADIPLFRLMVHAGYAADKVWRVCTPANAKNFSVVGYYFAREMVGHNGVPTGLILSAQAGTFLEQWLDTSSLADDPTLPKDTALHFNTLYPTFIKPVMPFAVRGILWYQGEQNQGDHARYGLRMQSLIKTWRRNWGQGDMPFLFVQLPNIEARQSAPLPNYRPWPEVREAQRLALAQPNTGMAVTIDIGDPDQVHYTHKFPVGYRLSLLARALALGESDVVASGPMFASMSLAGNKAHLRFRLFGSAGMAIKTGAGLGAPGQGTSKGFIVAGADGKWAWGEGVIHRDTVTVSSPQVAAPVSVRYAWAQNPLADLFNSEGLPASPFQSDGPQLPTGIWLVPGPASRERIIAAMPRSADAMGRRMREPSRGQAFRKSR
jgi:sialate O-acetylesterase